MLEQQIRALSLKQPFASLIVNGKKRIELRTRNTNYRGRFRVHASQIPYTKKEYMGILSDREPRGAIVGLAQLLDVKKYKNKEEFFVDRYLHRASDPNRFHDPLYGFVLGRTIKIKPIECKGSLNFFVPSIDLDVAKYL